MKTLTSQLNENIVFRVATAPKFYKDRADLLRPAKEVLSPKMMDFARDRIAKESLLPKGHKYLMCDEKQVFSLLVTESEGKRYSITFSGHGGSDIFIPLPDFDHVIDFIKSMRINIDLFKSSKL